MPPKRDSVGDVTESILGSITLSAKGFQDLSAALWSNRLWIDDSAAKEKYPAVFQFATNLIKRKRHSDMDEASQQEAVEIRAYNSKRNERTFVSEIWKSMHKDYRDKRTSGEPGSDIDDAEWTTETWHKAHLGASWDIDFRQESLPRLENMNATTMKLLNATPRIKNPKPDLAYGMMFTAFSRTELEVSHTYAGYSEISRGICFAFFGAEYKGSGGSMEEAELQACRGGAAMVNGVRELDKIAGLEKKDAGADMSSLAFTLAMTTTNAQLYVHWAEIIPKEPTIYHMHCIALYSLRLGSNYQDIRRDLNNILDWGLSERMMHVKATLNAINTKNLSAPPSNPPSKKQKTGTKDGEKGPAGMEKSAKGKTRTEDSEQADVEMEEEEESD